MKKIILNTMMSLLRRMMVISFTFLSLCCYSCATQNNMETPQDPIIGKWKLVEMGVPTGYMITYSPVELILEFKPDNMLMVQCLRQDNNCRPWNSGNYSYLYIDSNYGTKIQIGNTDWWYRVAENKLMIGLGPVDGPSYYFERM